MTPIQSRKKLIEVALPLEAINAASAREKSIRHGHPSTLHLWWARRPLAAARAVIFAQMVDDPASVPEEFPTREAQERERQRLFRIIEDLVQWENTTNERVLQAAREEIWKSWRRACRDHADHPRASELFNPDKLPAFHDPFAGGGALPLEAQRLGLESYASDLNPVAVLINKVMIEIPPRFAGKPPVNPGSRKQEIGNRKQEIGNRKQEIGNSEEEIGNSRQEGEKSDALSGVGGLAKGDGRGEGSLSAGTTASAGGNLRHAVADNPGGGVGTGQHRGGMDPRIGQGESTVSGDRSGLTGGNGDFPDPLRGDRLVSEGGDAAAAGPAERSGKDADDAAAQLSQHPLTPNSYFLFPHSYKGAQGLAEDVRYYGKWMRDEAERRIGHLYPKVKITKEMVAERPDLKQYEGKELTVIAWLWARTVKSPNPAYAHVDVPLASTFMLSTKPGKEAYVEVEVNRKQELENRTEKTVESTTEPYLLSATSYPGYRFTVKVGKPKDVERAKRGTKLARGANFECIMSGTPISGDYIKAEGKAGRMGARLMAIVAEGERGRVYLAPTPEHETAAQQARPGDSASAIHVPIANDPRALWCLLYGLTHFDHLFTPRQLVALTTFSDLVGEAMERVRRDALAAGLPDDPTPLRDGGTGATAYAEAVGVYLACGVSRLANRLATICIWNRVGEKIEQVFSRQAIPMTWDFAEANSFSDSTGGWTGSLEWVPVALETLPTIGVGAAAQADAASQTFASTRMVSTDPPYYDNIGYADLSDFFYVWLRRSLRGVFPDLFATLSTPKAEELVATSYRHGSKEKAEAFFLDGMTQAMHRLAEQAHSAFPVTIYYAFKQSETESAEGTSSTGWETFLDAVIRAGLGISGTWPMRTERDFGMKSGTNVLASSIVLVCRKRPADAPTATRREFVAALKAELPAALRHLQEGNIAPVDLAQAAIGPGMAVYTRFSKVLDAEGKPVPVREALALINQVLDETLAEQEGDFDADTRWALAWFDQHGFAEGEYGVAETLSKAKNTSVAGMVESGIVESKRGKVRLLAPDELPEDWDPASDSRLTVWEVVHQLIRVLETGGETAAAELVAKLGSRAEIARELAYRLYVLCERRKRTQEALRYNTLVQSWPEIARLASEAGKSSSEQISMFEERED